jgi:hypothetical protein
MRPRNIAVTVPSPGSHAVFLSVSPGFPNGQKKRKKYLHLAIASSLNGAHGNWAGESGRAQEAEGFFQPEVLRSSIKFFKWITALLFDGFLL